MKILIIEDNREVSKNIEDFLVKEGYSCHSVFGYDLAIDALISSTYDIIVLDIMLPDGNGLDILSYVKGNQIRSGIVITSAKNSLDDKLKGLDLGADDYITKPFHLPELNARIKAIFRRKNFNGEKFIQFNEIHIDPEIMEVCIADIPLTLTHKEYELLLYLLANKNRVLTKQSIAEHLWGEHADTSDSFDFVYQHIKNLRKKITKAGGKDYITNVYGLGYKFNTRVV